MGELWGNNGGTVGELWGNYGGTVVKDVAKDGRFEPAPIPVVPDRRHNHYGRGEGEMGRGRGEGAEGRGVWCGGRGASALRVHVGRSEPPVVVARGSSRSSVGWSAWLWSCGVREVVSSSVDSQGRWLPHFPCRYPCGEIW